MVLSLCMVEKETRSHLHNYLSSQLRGVSLPYFSAGFSLAVLSVAGKRKLQTLFFFLLFFLILVIFDDHLKQFSPATLLL